jgi:hypothetical protein
MVTLPQLLAVLHRSDRSFSTLHARYRVWEEPTVAREAFLSAFEPSVTHQSPTSSVPTILEVSSFLEVWQAPPQIRVDETAASTTHIASDDFMPIFRPWRLPGPVHLEVAGEGAHEDRPTVQVIATPRDAGTAKQNLLDTARDLGCLGPGATRYEMEIDAELGIVIRTCARFGDRRFREIVVQSLELNEPLPSQVFA